MSVPTLIYHFFENYARIFKKTKQELKLRNYSFKTTKAYLGCLLLEGIS
jgi:hypothetical protein